MKSLKGNITPAIQYKDAPAAIEWLCKVLGFEKHLVVPMPDGKIAHAQLTNGAGMIMLSSENDTPYSKHMISPLDIDNKNTQSLLLYVPDNEIAEHYQNALAHKVVMLVELRSEEYGGQYYSLKDIEGHLWSVGSYDPYAEGKNGKPNS